jgi:catechol 2,3-dioxygenase-like lactoylglutathione lyase family enzyme
VPPPSGSALSLLGRFHEISVPTPDIRASITFYEQLGFAQAQTGDAWRHPYAVMTDGRIALGLHQQADWEPSLTFVRGEITQQAMRLEASGITLAFAHLADDQFNELGLRDPAGQLIRLVEARTYSPLAPALQAAMPCGHFAHLSIPVANRAAAQSFWESLGFVALAECADPYPHLPLTSDHVDVAFHDPQLSRESVLVFVDEAMSTRLERLRARGIEEVASALRAAHPSTAALLRAPEGTLLLLANEN